MCMVISTPPRAAYPYVLVRKFSEQCELAHISHKLSTAEPQCRALTALHSIWVLNVLQVRFRARNFNFGSPWD